MHSDGQAGVGNKGESKLKVYTRRKKHGRQEEGSIEDLTSHNPLQESTSKPIPNSSNVPFLSPSQCSDDLNQPIAHRKGVRFYTQHPLSNFVSYNALSETFCVFSMALSIVVVHRSVSEALKEPK